MMSFTILFFFFRDLAFTLKSNNCTTLFLLVPPSLFSFVFCSCNPALVPTTEVLSQHVNKQRTELLLLRQWRLFFLTSCASYTWFSLRVTPVTPVFLDVLHQLHLFCVTYAAPVYTCFLLKSCTRSCTCLSLRATPVTPVLVDLCCAICTSFCCRCFGFLSVSFACFVKSHFQNSVSCSYLSLTRYEIL